MSPTFWHQLDSLARRLTPFGLTLILMLVGLMPFHMPEFARVVPSLPIIAVYHWSIHRPTLLPASLVFLVGFLQDILSGTPLGLNILILLTVYGIVLTQKRFFVNKSFAVVWLGFALVSAVASVVGWILTSAFNVTLTNPNSTIAQYVITLGVFPLLSWSFLRWQQHFLTYEA